MKKRLLIYGAGAIGRGYLPWVYPPSDYEYFFVEANPSLQKQLKQQRKFTTHKTMGRRYESLTVPVEDCFAPGEEYRVVPDVDAILTAVGPRNLISLREPLTRSKAPIICAENDSSSPEFLATITGNHRTFFAVPDVITSSTAPTPLLAKDPLGIVTEDGVCIVDARASRLGGNCRYVDRSELQRQWLAKLYVHNTPHCIAAYLGARVGARFMHEAMKNKTIARVVEGAMREMESMLLRQHGLDKRFVRWYAKKELSRFRNVLLFDPISRVAREPFRKLGHKDRLIGAASLCLSAGIVPEFLATGIMAAFCYENPDDPDANIMYLMRSLEPKDFLRIIIRLRQEESLFGLLLSRWKENSLLLKRLAR